MPAPKFTNIDRSGSPRDLLTTPEAGAVLGWTERYFTVSRSTGHLELKPAITRGKNLFARADLWAAADRLLAARSTAECAIDGCDLTGRASRDGLCARHDTMAKVAGTRRGLRGRPPAPQRTAEGLLDTDVRRSPGDGCWDWCGPTSKGYGKARLGSATVQAHVMAFEVKMGRQVRDGFELDHTCENTLCVRVGPGHVVEATHRANVERRTRTYWAARAAFFEATRAVRELDMDIDIDDEPLAA